MTDAEWVARFLYFTARALGRSGATFTEEQHKVNGTNGTSRKAMAERISALPWSTGLPDAEPADDSERKP